MNTTTDDVTIPVDPRVIAAALRMDGTDDLARVLTQWAREALPTIEFERSWAPTPLDTFDACVERSRRLLEDAHEAMRAYDEDNPVEETEVVLEDA